MSDLREKPWGYVKFTDDKWGFETEHRIVAMNAMGKALPPGAQVHHVNGDRADNRPCNLVVCEDMAYHLLLHRRQEALEACGHADWEKCNHCGEYGPEDEVIVAGHHKYHRECNARYQREREARNRRTGMVNREDREDLARRIEDAKRRGGCVALPHGLADRIKETLAVLDDE